MSETLGKENKEPKLLYRLDRRNPLMVMIDFISYSFFLLVPALPTAIYYDDWMRILGILGSALLIWLLYSVIFFNYVEIYRDKIVIDRFIFGNQIIKPENIIHCRTLERAFLPAHVEIAPMNSFCSALISFVLLYFQNNLKRYFSLAEGLLCDEPEWHCHCGDRRLALR